MLSGQLSYPYNVRFHANVTAARYRWLSTLLALTCSGCMTSAAITELPQRAKLNPEPPRYYVLSLDLVLGGNPYHIDYSWRCEQKKVFTASVMQWVLQWKSEFKIVAKRFADGTVIFLWQPAYCVAKTTNIVPRVVVSSDEPTPNTVALFDTRFDEKNRGVVNEAVIQGRVRRVDSPSSLGKMNEREDALAAAFAADLRHYVSRRIYVVPESIWKQSQKLNLILPKLHEVTSAKSYNPRSYGYFAATNGVPSDAYASDDVRLYTPRSQGQQLVLGRETKKGPDRLFRLEKSQESDRQVQLCYQQRCIWLEGAINEVYYPSTRELLYVDHLSLKTAFTR